jgi:hypothetical protein
MLLFTSERPWIWVEISSMLKSFLLYSMWGILIHQFSRYWDMGWGWGVCTKDVRIISLHLFFWYRSPFTHLQLNPCFGLNTLTSDFAQASNLCHCSAVTIGLQVASHQLEILSLSKTPVIYCYLTNCMPLGQTFGMENKRSEKNVLRLILAGK